MRAWDHSLLQLLLDTDLKNHSMVEPAKGDGWFSYVQKCIWAQESMLFRKEKWECSENHLKTSWLAAVYVPRGLKAHAGNETFQTPFFPAGEPPSRTLLWWRFTHLLLSNFGSSIKPSAREESDMDKLPVIYDLRQHRVKIGSESERQSNSIVTRHRDVS